MNTNKILITTSIIILILIFIPTMYKTVKTHEDNLYKVLNKEVIEAYKKCLNEEVCKSNKATLEELYQNKYLDKLIDPVTKRVYNEDSYVIKKDNNYKFVVIY